MIHDFYIVCDLAYKVSGENVKAELQSVIAILGPLLLNDSAAVCSKVCKGVLLCVGMYSLFLSLTHTHKYSRSSTAFSIRQMELY